MSITVERVVNAVRFRWYCRRIAAAVAQKRGLEIGGPSLIFSPQPNFLFPAVYSLAASVDNVNFASHTVWSQGEEGNTFAYLAGRAPGRQYVQDATCLDSIEARQYDFLLASHVLEHVANPLKALREWRRVLKPNGVALILLPNKNVTFDHRRPDTTLAHVREDFARDQQEDDRTHVEEILASHDLALDPLAGTPEQFRERSLKNFENRCLHHHVFSPALIAEVCREAGFDPLYVSAKLPPHILAFCRLAKQSAS